MKIYNINTFEKFSINPIKINDLPNYDDHLNFNFNMIYINPNKLCFGDLKTGYIIKIKLKDSVWMIFDAKHVKELWTLKLLRYDPDDFLMIRKSENDLNFHLAYNGMFGYTQSFPNYEYDHNYDITAMYKTDINIDDFRSKEDFNYFYDEYMLKL